jgi:hypothetical protein
VPQPAAEAAEAMQGTCHKMIRWKLFWRESGER